MNEPTPESRTISTIRTGTKVAVVVGLCLIAVAAYFYFTPVYLTKPEGGIFMCGSPSSPNGEAKNVCEGPEGTSQARAFLTLGMGVLVIVLGFALFGMKKVENRSPVIDRDGHDDDDHDGDDDRDRRDRRDDDAADEPTPLRSSRRHAKKRRDDDEFPSRSSRRDDEFPSRSSRRDDEFPSRSSRRDDDWSADGWR